MGAIPEKKQHIQILLDRAKKKKLSQKIIDSLAKQLQEFDDICEKKEFCKSRWGIKDIKANPKMFVSEKFNDRFDLSELLNGGTNNENEVLYKLVDSHTDNTWFKTAEQLVNFIPPRFNKYDLIADVVKIHGSDRFDFSKSVFKGKSSKLIVYDNYLVMTRSSTIDYLCKCKKVDAPNREAMVKKITDRFGKRYNTDDMIYVADHLPITIFDNDQGKKVTRTWAELRHCIVKKEERKKREVHSDDNMYNILVNTHPNYFFDRNDFIIIKKKKGGGTQKFIKYQDKLNGETYTHQSYATLLKGYGRTNKKAHTEEAIKIQAKKKIKNIDIDSIVFEESQFRYETKYYVVDSSKIKYKVVNGEAYHMIYVETLFTNTAPVVAITRDVIIQKFKEIDTYNIFSFEHIVFDEIQEFSNNKKPNISTRKFKIYNTITKKFSFTSIFNFKKLYKRQGRNLLRLGSRSEYKYLDKSDTTKNGHVDVICPVHGLFSQWSHNHFYRGDCCPLCNASVGEIKMYQYFIDNNIKFIYKFKAHKLMDIDFLRFDFFLPDLNIYIQFNGEHHYETVKWSNSLTDEELDERLFQEMYHDELKFEYCEKNNYDYIVLHYSQRNEVEKYLEKGIQEISEKRKNKVNKVNKVKENNGSINTRTDTRRVAEAC